MPKPPRRRIVRTRRHLAAVLSDYGVKVVGTNVMREARETHAISTLQRMLDRHGETHLRDVLALLVESEGNELSLTKPVIDATSGLLRAHADWYARDASHWLEVFDRLDLLAIHEHVKRNRLAAKPADAIATVVFQALCQTRGERTALSIGELPRRKPSGVTGS